MTFNKAEMERKLKEVTSRVVRQKREYLLTEPLKGQIRSFFLQYYKYGVISKIDITSTVNRSMEFVASGEGVTTTTTIEMMPIEETNFIFDYFKGLFNNNISKGYLTLDMDANKLTYEVILDIKEIR